jgi:hypothetical protein
MPDSKDRIAWMTMMLRTSDDPFYSTLRKLLIVREIDVNQAVLAKHFPDNTCFEFGILVTGDRRAFQFGFDYLNKDVKDAELTEWEDITTGSIYDDDVEAGLKYLDRAS